MSGHENNIDSLVSRSFGEFSERESVNGHVVMPIGFTHTGQEIYGCTDTPGVVLGMFIPGKDTERGKYLHVKGHLSGSFESSLYAHFEQEVLEVIDALSYARMQGEHS